MTRAERKAIKAEASWRVERAYAAAGFVSDEITVPTA
jgi:hypothetical protein